MASEAGQSPMYDQTFRLSDEMIALLRQPTIPLAKVGKVFFGIGPTATRAAAERGDLPLIRVGKKMFCPTGPLRKLLQIEDPQKAA